MNPRLTERTLQIVVPMLSILITLFVLEWSYRLKLLYDRPLLYNYPVTSQVAAEFDEKYGVHPKANLEVFDCFIRDGRVAWGWVEARSNRDGLAGKTTLEEYRNADVRVLVFGDSFSEWNRGGATWPDLLQQHLDKQFGRKFAVLNYARSAYGVLQMLDLAADTINENRPDLVIISVIGDDFTRARWWVRELDKDGIIRLVLSSRKDDFDDYHFASDQELVVPEATRSWCEKQLAGQAHDDPILEKANRQFAKIATEMNNVRKGVPLLSWSHSFLYKRIITGNPFSVDSYLPRLSITDFRQDKRARDDVRRIRMTGAQLLLVYLPLGQELRERRVVATRQERSLMNSLENMLGTRFHLIQREYNGKLPEKIDLLPQNGHPNRRGLQFYSGVISQMAARRLLACTPENSTEMSGRICQ